MYLFRIFTLQAGESAALPHAAWVRIRALASRQTPLEDRLDSMFTMSIAGQRPGQPMPVRATGTGWFAPGPGNQVSIQNPQTNWIEILVEWERDEEAVLPPERPLRYLLTLTDASDIRTIWTEGRSQVSLALYNGSGTVNRILTLNCSIAGRLIVGESYSVPFPGTATVTMGIGTPATADPARPSRLVIPIATPSALTIACGAAAPTDYGYLAVWSND